MKRNLLKKQLSIILLFLLSLLLVACEVKDKQTVVSQNVSQEVKAEEIEIQNNIEVGNQQVDEGKYDEAKKSYEKAISLEPSNKDTYVKIKDKYIEKQRLDDAFYITKLAINNSVDVDNMNGALGEIKKKFEVITIEKSLYQNNKYTLENVVNFKVNNTEEVKESSIKWNNTNIDTSKVGTFTYDGVIEQYGKSVKLILNVLPIIKDKKIGYIKDVYEGSGKRYIKLDEVEFYRDGKALEEAIKDKSNKVYFEDGKYHIFDGYYIRNNNPAIKTYEIDNNSTFELCAFAINKYDGNEMRQLSYNELKKIVNSKESDNPVRLCWIYTENNMIVKIEQQYIP